MRVRALNFISQYLTESYIDYIKEYLDEKGKAPFQPLKWTNENAKVPKQLKKSDNVEETLWILIRDDFAYDRLSITDDKYIHEIGKEYQKAIAIDFSVDSVTWTMYNNAKKAHHKMRNPNFMKYKACNE